MLPVRSLIERLSLPDGTPLLLRPLRPSDWRGLQAGFAELSPEDRRLRFFWPLPRLSDAAAQRLCRIDYDRQMALALFDLSRRPAAGIGVGRLVRDAAGPGVESGPGVELGQGVESGTEVAAELALVLLAPWRGRGLGRLLLTRLLAWARGAGFTCLHGLVLEENLAARRLLESCGFTLRQSAEGRGLLRAERRLGGAAQAATVASRSKA